MAVLVTGGAGYIGSHTCVRLLEAGYDVVVADNYYNSSPAALERVKKISGRDFKTYEVDMLDKPGLEKAFEENRIDSVIHFAGLKAVGESVEKPLLYYRTNIGGTLNLLELMVKYGVNTIVFSSSATVYGIPEKVPVTEESPLSAINPYGMTKLNIEGILRDCQAAQPDLSVVLLRYFNPIGSHKSGLLGEDPKGIPNNLLPYVSRVALGIYPHVNVYGGDYPTKDGTGVRDYIHVVDLAEGHVKALGWAAENKGAGVFNLGTGEGYSVFEIIAAFEKACGRRVPYQVTGRRAGDAPIVFADCRKAKAELDWAAVRGIDEMCRDAWNFVSKNPEGIK
ncbi:MAG: UDP-glucose 4-epimerase GalE [Oscillospiraceae bacterium]|jgi:UDP-glucose 4-epimerase|nr:UDP-glucose 4-epimerase GalE [Oscillospiraceae bacterium]